MKGPKHSWKAKILFPGLKFNILFPAIKIMNMYTQNLSVISAFKIQVSLTNLSNSVNYIRIINNNNYNYIYSSIQRNKNTMLLV